ncbi:MAG TPA: PsbP-related protein [Candidatus Nitrosocosmicus sp.]|nr:PsbP-related protein [Candidatus Nitrosocosmicus sp.]
MTIPDRYLQKSIGKILISMVILVFLFHMNPLESKDLLIFGFFHETQSQSKLTHTDNKFNYAIDFPANWEKSVKINNELILIAPKDKDSVSSPAGLVVKVVPTPGKNISANSASKEIVSQIQKEHKDFKLESSDTLTVDGKKAVKVVFTATDSKLQNRKAMQVAVSNYENIYVLTYKASLDKYNTFENTANDMIGSFKFLPK